MSNIDGSFYQSILFLREKSIHSFLNKINEYKWILYLQQQVSRSLFDVYMDCCSLSVTGPQTSTSQAILIKRYSKHYRHNVKSPYAYFMDQNGVHGYWNNKVFYCHWPSTSDINTLVCSKYLRKIYSHGFGNCPTT
jgi:hypothetical protein